MIFNLNVLRAIAILLVTNSHFDLLYPDPRLGTGGALGVSLFFALSGYGLAHSYRNREISFINWYWKRITRIFPSVWIVALLTLTFLGLWGEATPSSLFDEFIWPTRHWFISAIMLFYIAFFLLLASGKKFIFEITTALLLIPYAIGYLVFIDLSTWSIEGGYFKWIFYGQLMLLGAIAANREKWAKVGNLQLEAIALAVVFLVYFGTKLAMSLTDYWHFQFVIHLLTLPLLFLAFRVFASAPMQAWVENASAAKAFNLISGISLEIYLVQHLFHSNPWFQSLPFPLGAILAFVGILILARAVFWLAELTRSGLARSTNGTTQVIAESSK
jgi:peptidoglycan/LPS O-acetylase OafA/YrhL